MKTNLFIVHPCYNPKKDWDKKLADHHLKLLSLFANEALVSLILVNDGSTEGVHEEHIDFLQSKIPNFTYIYHSSNSGKGFALRSAVKNIHDGFIIYTDIDYPYQIRNLAEIFHLLNDGKYDVVLGVRTMNYYKKLPLTRVFFSFIFRLINHAFFPRMYVKDTQSGLKGFNQKGKNIFLKTKINGFLFDMEFIRLCTTEKLRMKKIFLQLNDGIAFEPIKWKVIKKESLNFISLLKK
jgi:glycosyltransferase involved in cell wall biosynthesis